MGFAEQMISSLRNNSRRKKVHIPFEKTDTPQKSTPIKSKNFSQFEKDILAKKLKTSKEIEKNQQLFKLILTLATTIIVIAIIVFTIKLTFF